ncbi:MAG: SLC13 family permease, partial [Celeribacter marinus]
MELFNFDQTTEAIVSLLVVGFMFVLFVREIYPTEVVAIAGASAMIVLGILPYDAGLAVLANPAPWTIAMMFVVMGALVRTGGLEWFTSQAGRYAESHPSIA